MASKRPVTEKNITNKDLVSDGRVFKLLERMEYLLNNEVVLKRSPQRALRLRTLYNKLKLEAEKRIQKLEETKRNFIVKWLNNIDINQIEPLELDPLKLDKGIQKNVE